MSHTLEHHEPCQCVVKITQEGTQIVYCPLHAAAPAMREALKELLTEDGHYLECEDRTHQETSWVTIKQCQQIQQVLAQVEGRT